MTRGMGIYIERGMGNRLADNFATAEDPGLVNAGAMDFSLKPDSVILEEVQGFEAIPSDEIGLYRDEYRRTVPAREAIEQAKRRPRSRKTREFAFDFATLKPGSTQPPTSPACARRVSGYQTAVAQRVPLVAPVPLARGLARSESRRGTDPGCGAARWPRV